MAQAVLAIHDPMTPRRQGADAGSRYRSVILVADADERRTAEAMCAEAETAGTRDGEVVTEIADLPAFHSAVSEHDDYFARHPDAGCCRAVIAPKAAKFRRQFSGRLKQDAVQPAQQTEAAGLMRWNRTGQTPPFLAGSAQGAMPPAPDSGQIGGQSSPEH